MTAPSAMSSTAILRELESHNIFFDDLVDLFPANLYVTAPNTKELEARYNTKYFKGQSKESKEVKRAKTKAAKRAKFDPHQAETTIQAKERREKEEAEESDESPDHSTTEKAAPPQVVEESPKRNNNKDPTTTAQYQSRIEALRAKLHAKMDTLRAKRPAADSNNGVSKRAGRRAEKLKRQEEAKKRKASKTETSKHSGAKSYRLGSAAAGQNVSAREDLKNMDFGQLAGLNAINSKTDNKALANVGKTKNYHKILAEAEEKKQRLQDLKQSGTEEDRAKAQTIVWKDALKEASGTRVKDDPAKIKKALKRKMQKKEKSTKAWKNRLEQSKNKMEERQKIRTHNLTQRTRGGATGANLSKKKIADDPEAPTLGRRSRAGFEGRKQDFLNQKD